MDDERVMDMLHTELDQQPLSPDLKRRLLGSSVEAPTAVRPSRESSLARWAAVLGVAAAVAALAVAATLLSGSRPGGATSATSVAGPDSDSSPAASSVSTAPTRPESASSTASRATSPFPMCGEHWSPQPNSEVTVSADWETGVSGSRKLYATIGLRNDSGASMVSTVEPVFVVQDKWGVVIAMMFDAKLNIKPTHAISPGATFTKRDSVLVKGLRTCDPYESVAVTKGTYLFSVMVQTSDGKIAVSPQSEFPVS